MSDLHSKKSISKMPRKKHTIETCQEVAKSRGGLCLETEYKDNKNPMRWRCKEGHEWVMNFSYIKNKKGWCTECSGNKKYTLEECQEVAVSRGGLCLETEYIHSRKKMRWMCKEEHEWTARFTCIKNRGQWCSVCSGNAKLTIEECHEVANSRGGECLETEYKDNKTKMRWRCEEGHEWETFFGNIKNQSQWCAVCAGNFKHTLEECQEVAESRGGECLETEYKDNKTKMRWRCKEGHEWTAIFRDVISRTWCMDCGGRKKLTLEECQEVAVCRGGECLETEYINCGEKMRWRCKEEHEWEASFQDIKNSNSWCPDCMNGKSEKLCRQIIEELTGKKFSSVRPDFLKHYKTGYNLELDGYNEELKLAFEYNGKQHYEYTPFYHRGNYNIFIDQQERDKIKIQMCNNVGIKVIVIPYQYNHKDEDRLRLFIKSLI